MNYLAIKQEKGRGVYQYKTKDEKKKILESLGVGQKAGKFFANKDEALKYAGVKEVANRQQQVVSDNSDTKKAKKSVKESNAKSSNSVVNILNKCKDRGFDFAKITLTNGVTFDVVLRDFYYLSSNVVVNKNIAISRCSKGEERFCELNLQNKSCLDDNNVYDNCSSFADYIEDLKSKISYYNEKMDKEYSSYAKKYVTIKDVISYINGLVYAGFRNDEYKIYNVLKSTKIEEEGHMLYFDKVSVKEFVCNNRGSRDSKFFVYQDNKDQLLVEDYILNTNYVLDIRPYKSEWKITDKEFLDAIKEMENNN